MVHKNHLFMYTISICEEEQRAFPRRWSWEGEHAEAKHAEPRNVELRNAEAKHAEPRNVELRNAEPTNGAVAANSRLFRKPRQALFTLFRHLLASSGW